jgi:predicted lipoprotein with Yx(FWY)xxD motif
MRRLTALAVPFVVALVLAGCGDDTTDSGSGTTSPPDRTTTSGDVAAPEGRTVALTDSDYGEILTTGDGMTLYLFTPDTGSTSTCTGGCATAWPALAAPVTGDGIDADDLGTTTRDDGTEQVTFYGHPVYTYADDSAPGDVNGQGVGGKWYVIDGDGEAVTAAAAAPTPTTAATKGGY